MSNAPNVAVIGTGIAGLACAAALAPHCTITVFEREQRIGGHSSTVLVPGDSGEDLAIDIGFIVYNDRNYPLLSALFAALGVRTQATTMSFSACLDDIGLEYAGTNLHTLFADRRRLLDVSMWRMLADIIRFNRKAKRLAAASTDSIGISLGQFMATNGFGKAFQSRYLLPMAGAIWSCSAEQMLDFPAASLARFFDNHGLLNISQRPAWRTVCGGSRSYTERLSASFKTRIRHASPVHSVRRVGQKVVVSAADADDELFDHVVIATHADEALSLLHQPNVKQREILSRFRYQSNRVVLHTDTSAMPTVRAAWSSWNYRGSTAPVPGSPLTVSYWMNLLHGFEAERDYIVTLNPQPGTIACSAIITEREFSHPVFDRDATQAQARLRELDDDNRISFCGSYFGYGFHEDALRSALAVARRLGIEPRWAKTSNVAQSQFDHESQSPTAKLQ